MRNLFWLLGVRLLINLGDSLFYVITIWRVADNFNSKLVSGIVVAMFTIPDLFQVFIGPILDRINAKHILGFAILLQLCILILVISLWHVQSVPLLAVFVLLSSLGSTITYPIEEIMIPKIVQQDKLVFANSLFEVSYRVLDSIFNGVSGLLLTAFSFIELYRLNSVIILLALIPLAYLKFSSPIQAHKHKSSEHVTKSYLADVVSGFSFLKKSQLMMDMTIPLTIMNFFTSVDVVALPYYCKLFDHSAVFFGIINTADGVGGILGAAIAGMLTSRLKSGKLISFFLIGEGLLWIIGVTSHNQLLTMTLMFFCAMLVAIYNIVYGTLYQVLPPNTMLGRVNTTVDTVISAAMPLGGILGGIMVNSFSPIIVLTLSGLSSIIAGAFYLNRHEFMSLAKIDQVRALGFDGNFEK